MTSCYTGSVPPDRPNFLLVTVECWRGDHLGALTPCLSDLAKESAVFSEAYACGGWTLPSVTALMSSAWSSMHGGPDVALATPQRAALAESLLANGYWTAGFTANFVCGSARGFHRGFGTFRDLYGKRLPFPDGTRDWKNWRKMAETGLRPGAFDNFCDAKTLTGTALNWLRSRKPGEPWFLWLHYFDPHWPCLSGEHETNLETNLEEEWFDRGIFSTEVIPSKGTFDPGPEARERWAGKYRKAVTATDLEIGRLLEALRARDDWGRTAVIATGDHGEELFERGTWHHSWNQLHREGIAVPLIVRIPGETPAGIKTPVSHLDVAPTLLDFAGIPRPEAMLGLSLRPLLEGTAVQTRPVYTEMIGHAGGPHFLLSIRDGDWKYLYNFEDPHRSKLFRVSVDPGETTDVRGDFHAIFRDFEKLRLAHVTKGLIRLMSRLRSRKGSSEFPPVADDEVLKDWFVALGYIES